MNTHYLFRDLGTHMIPDAFRNIMNILPNPDRVLARSGRSFSILRDLKNDAHVWSCIQSRKSGLLFLDHFLEGDKDRVKTVGKFLVSLDLPGLYSMILESIFYGYQPMEIIWKREGGLIVPERLEPRLQEHFAFDTAGRVRFRPPGRLEAKEVPAHKFLMACYEPGAANPYGEPLLSKCYWPVQFKNGGWKYWVSFMEKYGMPILMGKYSRGAGASEAEQLSKALNDAAGDSVIVMPDDMEVGLHEPHRYSSVRLYSELIKQSNSEISKALLSQTLTTEISSGSLAAAETHFKIRKELLMSDAQVINRTLGKLISSFEMLNFGASSGIRFKLNME